MSKRWKKWSPGIIRVVLVTVGLGLLFFTPAGLSGSVLPKIGGSLATLSGILGPDRMGKVNTAVVLALVYVFTVGPMWLLSQFGTNPLEAPTGPSLWVKKPPPNPEIEPRRRMRFQF